MFMVKQFFPSLLLLFALAGVLCLSGLANDGTNDKTTPRTNKTILPKNDIPKPEPNPPAVAAALLAETQAWAERADLWRLVARGETLAARVEIIAVKSNQLEAWVCGSYKICFSTRLMRDLSPDEQKAAFAHELGHLLIPRNYDAHPQLWEAQCDLFAATFLRDAEAVKQMLGALAADCANCSDQQHPPPRARAALVEYLSSTVIAKALKLDEFRGRSFAVNCKLKPRRVPQELQWLSFALQSPATKTPGPAPTPLPPQRVAQTTSELKKLNFTIEHQPVAEKSPTKTPNAR